MWCSPRPAKVGAVYSLHPGVEWVLDLACGAWGVCGPNLAFGASPAPFMQPVGLNEFSILAPTVTTQQESSLYSVRLGALRGAGCEGQTPLEGLRNSAALEMVLKLSSSVPCQPGMGVGVSSALPGTPLTYKLLPKCLQPCGSTPHLPPPTCGSLWQCPASPGRVGSGP